MSGFVGIVNLDGEPVDSELLQKLTQSLAFRGPDAQETWIGGNVGFGHAMLRTTWEAGLERQPCTLDGPSDPEQTWIVADCRIDAREDLIRELNGHSRIVSAEATDPELILHAWAVWGPHCLQHVIGDFSFAIWDGRAKRLFCGRDHMGVKLFYYARAGNCLVFGNTLNSLRLHPAVSDRLNEAAIGDFLLFGYNEDVSTTSFADIRWLLPAHSLICPANGDVRTERYWTLPVDPPLRLPHRRDYIEHFLDLLRRAVKDRMRADCVGILMSGGLDSPAMAAIAREIALGQPAAQSRPIELAAYTNVYDKLVPDRERYFAGLVAAYLGIPIQFHALDDYGFFEASRAGNWQCPDPALIPERGPRATPSLTALGQTSRVALYGEGPDNALDYDWKPYVKHEIAQRNFAGLLADAISFPFIFRKIPFWNRVTGAVPKYEPPAQQDGFPAWLNSDFASRLGLHERYKEVRAAEWIEVPPGLDGKSGRHPIRPLAHASFFSPPWQYLFAAWDPGNSGVPVEFRLPYIDIRMLRFLLSVPVVPWCRDKYLIRRAMRSRLPPEILERPKTGVAESPAFELWKNGVLVPERSTNLIADYVNSDTLRASLSDSPESLEMHLRPLKLDFFLRGIGQ